MKKLSDTDVAAELAKRSDWQLVDQKWLQKRFKFKAFLDGITFVNDIAKLSEEANHHPFISIDYKVITVKLTSWRAKGITDLDFELVDKYNDFYKIGK